MSDAIHQPVFRYAFASVSLKNLVCLQELNSITQSITCRSADQTAAVLIDIFHNYLLITHEITNVSGSLWCVLIEKPTILVYRALSSDQQPYLLVAIFLQEVPVRVR